MGALLRFWAVFVVAVKRLLSQRWLIAATALGLVAAVGLTASIPIYADAVYYRVLQNQLADESSGRGHAPFAFMFRYVGSWAGPVEWEDVQAIDEYLSRSGAAALGLPEQGQVRYFETDTFRMFPADRESYSSSDEPLMWVRFGFAGSLADHVTLTEGRFPQAAEAAPDSRVEIMISDEVAAETGLQIGERYTAFARRELESGQFRNVEVPVEIVGFWAPTDPEEPYWFYKPEALAEVFVVPEGTFVGRLAPYMDDEVHLAVWYLMLDGSQVFVDDVGPLLSRIGRTRQYASSLLPDTKLSVSPEDALFVYRDNVTVLTILLYAFSIPIVGLILAFIGLVVGLSVGRQRGEIAVLRSRGATTFQVLGIAALEAIVLGVLGLALGLPGGMLLAQLIGRARSFLEFSLPADLRVGVTTGTLRFGLAAIGLAFLAQIVPTIDAARHTIVTYKQDRARRLRPPWWQRIWLDVLLLIPAGYGAYVLQREGRIVTFSEEMAGDPFQNPLLFLVPALGIFSLTLFVLRVLPVVISGVAWVASRTKAVGTLLATRYLSRTPGFYAAPLILLVLTLSLSTFTASLAETLDNHLVDQIYYQVGADMQVMEMGEDTGSDEAIWSAATGQSVEDGDDDGPEWLFLPVEEHLKAPGVEAATRVGDYAAGAYVSDTVRDGRFVGVDRWVFAEVAFWRDEDFAGQSLGGLMNALGAYPNGVLVPGSFLVGNSLSLGDTIRIHVDTLQRTEIEFTVVGTFNYFPTWYEEEDGPLFVGNLDYVFEQSGGQFPYDVWLNVDPNVDPERIVDGLRELRLDVVNATHAPSMIASQQRRPERQGLFGVLSVGFIAAALLTVLGFLLYAFFSFRRRFVEMGMLRAVGLSARQMTAFLAWELAFLILTGALVGTGLGTWASHLFIPALQIGSDVVSQTPPFMVQIAWPAIIRIYVLFGVLFVAALGGLAALLMRMKIFQAVKLGETT